MRKLGLLLCVIFLFLGNVFAQKRALIVIDIQNDYFKGGAMELVGSDEAAANAEKVIEDFRKNKLPVIYIQHISEYEGATFFLPNTDGNKINNSVKPAKNDKIIIKHYPNSFKNTELLEYLQKNKVEELVIVGMMTHMCVEATTRAASDLGYKCTLLSDACATRDVEYEGVVVPAKFVQAAYLSALNGAYATIIKTKDFSLGKR
ncbi:MAG: cysteine hydrolase family protein [Paludibacteraceae bacterium]|nr:cysteine hydrolase [Prevotellaceae bacterium]